MLIEWKEFLIPALQIIWIDLLLSGDNAVVIALACRGLPENQRSAGILLGSGTAVLLRVVFTILTVQLINLPWLKAIGALALIWIAVKLIVPDKEDHRAITSHAALWKAVRTVAVADIVMSLDNVIAIAAAAKGSIALVIFGLAVSIPLVVGGSALMLKLIARWPALVWAGAALLGWIAGEIFATDPGIVGLIGHHLPQSPAAIAGVVLVVFAGLIVRRRKTGHFYQAP